MAKTPTPYGDLIEVLNKLPVLIRETRRRRQLTIRQAAAELGRSGSTVWRYEAGPFPGAADLIDLLHWLNDEPTQAQRDARDEAVRMFVDAIPVEMASQTYRDILDIRPGEERAT